LFVLILLEEGMTPDTAAAEMVYSVFSTFTGTEGGAGGGGFH